MNATEKDKAKHVIAAVLKTPLKSLTESATLVDLGMNSFEARDELTAALNAELGLEITEEESHSFGTVADVYNVIDAHPFTRLAGEAKGTEADA